MEVGQMVATFLFSFVYFLIGFLTAVLWEEAIDDIRIRAIRVSVRLAITLVWPLWLALWAVAVVLGIIGMILEDLFK